MRVFEVLLPTLLGNHKEVRKLLHFQKRNDLRMNGYYYNNALCVLPNMFWSLLGWNLYLKLINV